MRRQIPGSSSCPERFRLNLALLAEDATQVTYLPIRIERPASIWLFWQKIRPSDFFQSVKKKSRLNLAHLAEDATSEVTQKGNGSCTASIWLFWQKMRRIDTVDIPVSPRPPQSGSFGRRCDLSLAARGAWLEFRLNLAHLAEDATKAAPEMYEFGDRLNLAHLAEDATETGREGTVIGFPPQSGSFGRRCDLKNGDIWFLLIPASIWLIWQKMRPPVCDVLLHLVVPPQSGSFGRRCDLHYFRKILLIEPPQSGSFGRRCDGKETFYHACREQPPQSGSFGRRCDRIFRVPSFRTTTASIWLIWQKMRLDCLRLPFHRHDSASIWLIWQKMRLDCQHESVLLLHRLNLAHLAEDATQHVFKPDRFCSPPQSGSFGRRCDTVRNVHG